MEILYLLVILVGTTCGKVAVYDEKVHTNDITKHDSTSNITDSLVPTEANPTDSQNNIKEHVSTGDDSLPTTNGSEPNTNAHENTTGDDFLITVQVDSGGNPLSSTAKRANKPLEALDVNFLNIIHVTDLNKVLTSTTTPKSAKDPLENDLDVDFLNIISDYEDKSSSEIPAYKVDNGTALLLTPFVKEGRFVEARTACQVDSDLFLGFESYSGFLTVDEKLKSHLFFWYFPVPERPVNETPWIVWLQGGPGASSLVGLFDEIGPFTVSPYGTFKKNRHSWIQNHSLLFIDNPVGTGYSFTESPNGYAKDLETYSTHLHTAMKQFIQIFPELQTAPFFVTGESYAGKYVPALAHKIHRDRDTAPHFNLQGVILGNAMVDPEEISNIVDSFQYFGLVDPDQVDLIRPLVDSFRDDIAHNRSTNAKSKWVSLISALLFMSNQKHAYNFLRDNMVGGKYTELLDKTDVKRALHVGDILYSRVNVTVNRELAPEFLSSTRSMLEELLDHYRVLIYCGHLDQMLPCLVTSKYHRTWKWNGTEEFLQSVRYPYIFNGRNAGYHKTGGRLTEVVFRGAGHMVPQDAPAPAQALVARFTHNQPLGKRSRLYEQTLLDMKMYLQNVTQSNVTDSMFVYL